MIKEQEMIRNEEQEQQEEKRMYSINLIAYVISKRPDVDYIVRTDEDGRVYYVFQADLTEEIREYKNSKDIQDFLAAFRDVKRVIYNKSYRFNE